MARVGEDLLDGSEFDEFSGIHYSDAVGELCHQTHVVADEDHGGTNLGSDVFEGFHDLSLYDDIKGAGWFVGEDESRFVGYGHGDGDALLHSSAEFMGEEIQHAAIQSDLGHQGIQTFL